MRGWALYFECAGGRFTLRAFRLLRFIEISYADAAVFVAAHHSYANVPPPRVQIRRCFAIAGKRIHIVAMVGNPVAPAFSKTHLEVRRVASDGKVFGANSEMYKLLGIAITQSGKIGVTYTRYAATSLAGTGWEFDQIARITRDNRIGRARLVTGSKLRYIFNRESMQPLTELCKEYKCFTT